MEAKQTITTPALRVLIKGFTLQELLALFSSIKMDVNGTLDVVIGDGFVTDLFYAQQNVPGSFVGGPTRTLQTATRLERKRLRSGFFP